MPQDWLQLLVRSVSAFELHDTVYTIYYKEDEIKQHINRRFFIF